MTRPLLKHSHPGFDEWFFGRWQVQFFAVSLWRWGLWRRHRDRVSVTWATPFFAVKRSIL